MGEIQTASIPRTHQVLNSLRNSIKIADAVPIRILKRSWIHLVDHGPLPPSVLFHVHSSVLRRERHCQTNFSGRLRLW